jgi:hypothetical protein
MQIKIMRKDGENKSTGNKPFEAPLSSSPKHKKRKEYWHNPFGCL